MSALTYSGEIAALLAALLWAVASLFFERVGKKISSVELNLFKGILALLFIGVTMLVSGGTRTALEPNAILLLVISGVIGIGLGDTVFFKSLEQLGPRKALLIGSLTPAMTALIALVALDEMLSWQAWLGMVITSAGVAWVVTEDTVTEDTVTEDTVTEDTVTEDTVTEDTVTEDTVTETAVAEQEFSEQEFSEQEFSEQEFSKQSGNNHNQAALPFKGLGYGILASICQAISAVLSRAALTQTLISPLQSSMLRLISGVVIVSLWIVVARVPVGRWLKGANARTLWAQGSAATFLGTYLGMWLQQSAYKYSPAGIAQTLSSTSPLFILPFAALTKEKLSLRAVLGAVIAVIGITLLFVS